MPLAFCIGLSTLFLVITADLGTLRIISGDFATAMEMSLCLSRDAMLAINHGTGTSSSTGKPVTSSHV